MNLEIDNKLFEVRFSHEFSKDWILEAYNSSKFQILSQPKKILKYEILYYLSLGLYDRRGWKYKVKVIK